MNSHSSQLAAGSASHNPSAFHQTDFRPNQDHIGDLRFFHGQHGQEKKFPSPVGTDMNKFYMSSLLNLNQQQQQPPPEDPGEGG